MNKLSINDLLLLGVEMGFEQREAHRDPTDVAAWMIPWKLPDPEAAAIYCGGYEDLLVPNESGKIQEVWWPRLLSIPRDEYREECERDARDTYQSSWFTLPYVLGYDDSHMMCTPYGCTGEDESPQLVAAWCAWPLTWDQAERLDVSVGTAWNRSPWLALHEYYSFEERYGIPLDTLMDQATAPIPAGATDSQIVVMKQLQDQAVYALEELNSVCNWLGFELDEQPPLFTTAHYSIQLDPELDAMWRALAGQIQYNAELLKSLFPQLANEINGSSTW